MIGRRPTASTVLISVVAVSIGLATLRSSVASAQAEPDVQASVDRDLVRLGDDLNYTLRISASGQVAMSLATQPGFDSFEVLSTSQGTELRSGTGGTHFVRTVTARIRPTKTGKFTIRGPSVKVATKTVQGNAVNVEVVEAGEKLPTPAPSNLNQPILLRVIPDDVRPYVGEQVLVEYALYQDQSKVGPFGAEVTNATEPSFDGLWIEDLTKTLAGKNRYEVIGSKSYAVSPIKLLAVFPLNAGALEVEPMEIEVNVGRVLRRSTERVASDSFTLDVRELPKPAPDRFDAANVGRYTLSVRADKRSVAVGEPLTVTIAVSGTGMASRVALPTLPKMAAFRALEPVVDKETRLSAGRVQGSKSAQIVLTPLKTGTYEIPPLEFNYFDPDEEVYKVARSARMTIGVAGTWGPEEHDEDLIERTETNVPAAVQIAKTPLAPIRALETLPPKSGPMSPVSAHPLFLLGLLLPPFGYSGWLLAGLFRRNRETTRGARTKRNAPKRAKARLEVAATLADANKGVEAMSEIGGAMTEFFVSLMEVPPGAVSTSKIRRFLAEQGASDDLLERFTTVWARCDEARFGGIEAGLAANTIAQAYSVIDELAPRLGGEG